MKKCALDSPESWSIREAITARLEIAIVQLCGGTSPVGCPSDPNSLHDGSPLCRKAIRNAIFTSISFPNNHVGSAKKANPLDNICGKPHDVEVRIALTLFHQWKRHRTSNEAAATSPSSCITIISDLGLSREISTPRQFADLICPIVEDDFRIHPDLQSLMAPDVRAQPSGVLSMMTLDRSRQLRWAGRLPCPLCTQWCRGEKGLWWHQQQYHNVGHSDAAATAMASTDEWAVVLYRGGGNNDAGNEGGGRDCEGGGGFSENDGRGSGGHNTTSETSTKRIDGLTTLGSLASTGAHDPFECIKQGDLEGLKYAVEKDNYKPSVSFDPKGATPLMWAAGGGHLDVVQYLIEECRCDPREPQKGKRSFSGRTALHWASRNGHLKVVQYLLQPAGMLHDDDFDAQSLLDATTQDGTTAFGWACWQRHLDVMDYLYHRGCNIHTVNSFGCNAVLWCAQGKDDPGVSDSGDKTTTSGVLQALQWLQARGCNMTLVNHNGHGVLHKAAQRGQQDVGKWFVQQLGLLSELPQVHASATSCDATSKDTVALLALIGPDTEGYCPSDLAGMEGHEDFAMWLASVEKRICRLLNCVPQYDNIMIPDEWGGDFSSITYDASMDFHWERYGGLRRMGSALQRKP